MDDAAFALIVLLRMAHSVTKHSMYITRKTDLEEEKRKRTFA